MHSIVYINLLQSFVIVLFNQTGFTVKFKY